MSEESPVPTRRGPKCHGGSKKLPVALRLDPAVLTLAAKKQLHAKVSRARAVELALIQWRPRAPRKIIVK